MLESLELSRRLTPVTHNSKKTRVTVEIRNRSYTIVGDEDASHVRLVASLVDQKMREIHELNPSLDTAALAVLTAINSMNDYLTLKEDYATLLGSIKKERG
jgi:cell division protein ZapA